MSQRSIEFTVPGKPRGQARVQQAGRFGHKYVDKKTRDYRDAIRWALRKAYTGPLPKPTSRPIRVQAIAVFEPPVSWPKWKREAALAGEIAPTVKPDDDNIGKIIRDALNGVLWIDDQQVVASVDDKRYGPAAYLQVTVSVTDQLPANCSRADWENHQSPQVDCYA